MESMTLRFCVLESEDTLVLRGSFWFASHWPRRNYVIRAADRCMRAVIDGKQFMFMTCAQQK